MCTFSLSLSLYAVSFPFVTGAVSFIYYILHVHSMRYFSILIVGRMQAVLSRCGGQTGILNIDHAVLVRARE